MGFLHNLRYRLRMLTSSEIAVGAKMLPGWVGMGPKIGSAAPKKDSIAGDRHKHGENCPDIGTRPSH